MSNVSTKDKRQIAKVALLGVAILAAVLCFVFSAGSHFTLASSGDTFEIVFPTTSYFQADNPSLITTNATYTVIFDNVREGMFVRGGDERLGGTTFYPFSKDSLSISEDEELSVTGIHAVGKTLFVGTNFGCFTIDLSDVDATPQSAVLASPLNASSFVSDGTYLYAKSVAGYVSIYDENLDIAFGVDNALNEDLLAGKPVLSGKGGMIYAFPLIEGDPYLVTYDPTSALADVSIPIDCYVTKAYVGKTVIYAQLSAASSDGKCELVAIDISSGEKLFTVEDLSPVDFSVVGDDLFVIDGKKIDIFNLNEHKNGLVQVGTVSMAGGDLYHLYSPADIVTMGDFVVVADEGNGRICYLDSQDGYKMTAVTNDMYSGIEQGVLDGMAPHRLATDGRSIYALYAGASKNCVLKINDFTNVIACYDLEGAVDVTFLDKLYILTDGDDGGLWTIIAGKKTPLSRFFGGKRLDVADGGTNIFVMSDSGVTVFDKNGVKYNTNLTADFSDALDFAVDFAGNFTVLTANGMDTYVNRVGSLTKTSSTPFVCANARATANSIAYVGDGMHAFFTAEECFVGKCTVAYATRENFVGTTLDIHGDYHFARLDENVETSYRFDVSGKMENISAAPKVTILLFDEVDGEGKSYALLGGEFFKVIAADYREVETQSFNSVAYVSVCDTTLYELPDVNSEGNVDCAKSARFNLVADCADYDGGRWLRVSYEQKIYFIKAAHCDEYVKRTPINERVYGRAKATRVGGLVGIYEEQNADGAMLKEIVDGTKVEILEQFDSYYRIRIDEGEENEIIGYMLKDEVQIGGLTTVQIISIVLAIFVAIVGTGVFMASEFVKRRAQDNPKPPKTKKNR